MVDCTVLCERMIKSQILPLGVSNPLILQALLSTPKEQFASSIHPSLLYSDQDILIGKTGRSLINTAAFARLIEAAHIKATDHILEIGCTVGYTTKILSFLADHITAIESNPDLFLMATENLAQFHDFTGEIFQTALHRGYPTSKPYDVIIINGAIQNLPDALLPQLKESTGRLVTFLQPHMHRLPQATLFRKINKSWVGHPLFEAAASPLPFSE